MNDQHLIINNETPHPIYHEVLPSEVLPFIEWAPCAESSKCPDSRIGSMQETRLNLPSIADNDQDFVYVFWWHLSGPDNEIDVDYNGVQKIKVEVPPRVSCG